MESRARLPGRGAVVTEGPGATAPPARRPALRHRLEHAGFRLARRLVLALPHERSRALGRRLGVLAWGLAPSLRRLAHENLARALPGLDAGERREAARRSFEMLVQNLCETVSALRFAPSELEARVEVVGLEHVEVARRAQPGLFLLTAHLGYWIIGAARIAHELGGLAAVYRPTDNPLFEAEWRILAAAFGFELLPKHRAALGVVQRVRSGGTVAVLLDQRARQKLAIEVPFFGVPSLTSPGLAALSLRTGAAVVPGFCTEAGPGRYRLVLSAPILPAEGGEREGATARLTALYNAALEREIRAHPGLWMWMHRRWKGSPTPEEP